MVMVSYGLRDSLVVFLCEFLGFVTMISLHFENYC